MKGGQPYNRINNVSDNPSLGRQGIYVLTNPENKTNRQEKQRINRGFTQIESFGCDPEQVYRH